MDRTSSRILAGALVLAAAACGESTAPNASSDLLANALTTISPGFTTLSSSFSESATAAAWVPGPGGPGRMGLSAAGSLLGGGIAPEFLGGAALGPGGFGPGRGHGPPLPTCTGSFSATTGRVTCATVSDNGLTINRSFAYLDAAGKAQSAFDSTTTNSINEKVDVAGTTTFTADSGRGHGHGPGFFGFGRGPDSSRVTVTSATSTVKHSSDRTTSGLLGASRTVNSTSTGSEATTGTSSAGTFTATRTTGDTTKALVIPKPTTTNTHPYPSAGTVIRAMNATVTFAGKAAQTTSRREVITYDGSATAKLTITQDGTTKNCTVALPHGRPACS